MSPTASSFHERLTRTVRTVLLGPFAQFLDGEDRQLLSWVNVAAGFGVTTLIVSLALTLLGLEDSMGLGFLTSWWVLWLHSLAGLFPLALLTRVLRGSGLGPLAASVLALIPSYPILVLASLGIDALFLAGDPDGEQSVTFLSDFLSESWEVLPAAAVVWAAVAGFLFSEAVALRTGSTGGTASENREIPWPDCLAEVPPAKRGVVIGLSSDQHYLKVETVAGESYIRGSLSDAMVALSSIRGLHIHRSHWVALGQVDHLVDEGGVLYCVMSSGKRYPVSRRRRAQTRAALRGALRGNRGTA